MFTAHNLFMKNSLLPIVDRLIKYLLLLTIVGLPLVFLTNTSDTSEFPKQLFLITSSLLLLALWLIKNFLQGQVKITRTPLDLPILAFLATHILATIFAPTWYNSLVGVFGFAHPSLVTVATTTIIYFVITSNLTSLKDVVNIAYAVILGASLAVLGATLNFFNWPILPIDFTRARSFTAIGTPATATILAAFLMPTILGLLNQHEKQSNGNMTYVKQLFLWLAAVLLGIYVILINTGPVYIILAVGVAVFLLFSRKEDVKDQMSWLAAIALPLVIVALFWLSPQLKEKLPAIINVPALTMTQLDNNSAWFVVANTIREHPFFGSGPGTFLYDFTRFRPLGYNQTPLWNIRFANASNEYFTWIATTGIIGFLAVLYLVVNFLRFILTKSLTDRQSPHHPLKLGLGASLLAILVGWAFTSTQITIFVMPFIFLALLAIIEKASGDNMMPDLNLSIKVISSANPNPNATSDLMPTVLMVPGMVLVAVCLFLSFMLYDANASYVKGVMAFNQNKGDEAFNNFTRAVQENQYQDIYRLARAQTALAIANAISAAQPADKLTEQQKQTITTFVNVAIQESRNAAAANPLNVANWQALAQIYRSLAGAVKGADQSSLQAYLQAMQTDTINPQLRLDLGGLFYAAENYDRAIAYFQDAVNLKPDLANAHYNLANALVKKRDFNNAFIAYQNAKALTEQLPDNTAGKQENLDKLNSEINAIADATTSAQPAPTPTPTPTR